MTGSYEYTAPNDEVIYVVYEADENGFRPKVTIRFKGKAVAQAPPQYAVYTSAPGVPYDALCSLLGGCK